MAAVTRDVVVLGGGISGLTLAYFLRQALPKAVADATRIRVLDASTASGGWVRTAKREGFLFEEGPRGFRPSRNGAEMLRLVEQLQLQGQMQAVDPAAQARYILRDGKVEKLPTSLLEALRWPLSLAVARAALHELFVKPGAMEDESVYKFIARRFSPLVAEKLLDPMASGIFGGDIRKLSIRSCFPMLVDLEKKHGSVVKGMLFGGSKGDDTLLDGTNKSAFVKKHEKSISVSFTDGMSTLMDALADSIKNDPMADLQLNTKVTRLEVHGQNNTSSKGPRFVVESKDPTSGEIQEPIRASHVFSTIPACYLAPVVKDTAPGLAEALNEIKFVDMSMVHVGYNEKVLMTDGFGYLIPTSEREKVLGVVFDSNTFPVQNAEGEMQTRLSVMSGGAHFREVASLPEGELERNALDALKRHLGITQMPDYVRAMTMTNGIPQYHVGFGQTLQRIEKQATRSAPGLFLGGNSFYGIGLADCVTHSKHLALKFAKIKHRDAKASTSSHVAAELLEGATRSVGIQTVYRDSEAQTDPYTPDYTIQKTATGITPEIATLVGLNHGRGQLPIGHAELELIERNRKKRAFESSLPPMTDEASFLLRKAMLEAQETREWAYREAEIDAFHDQRVALLRQALAEREKENAFLSEQRLEALRQRLLHDKENALEAIQQERVAALRKLTKKRAERQHERGFGASKPERGRDIIADYANFGSQVYAPITRDGKAGKTKVSESGIGKPQFLQLDALRELESTLPARMLQSSAGKYKPREKSGRTAKERKQAAIEAHLLKMESIINKNKEQNEGGATTHGIYGQSHQNTDSPLSRRASQRQQQLVRPPTPDYALTHVADAQENDVDDAVRLLQKLLRGRAVQNMMFEGKERRSDLIAELRAADEQLALQRRNEFALLQGSGTEAVDRVANAAKTRVEGEVVSEMLDFLSKELSRSREMAKMRAFVIKATEERRAREVEEGGRRQAEDLLREREDEVFRRVMQVHQETSRDFVDDVLEEIALEQSHAQALNQLHIRSAGVDGIVLQLEDEMDSDETVVRELVASFLLPHVQRQHVRRQVTQEQKKYVTAAHTLFTEMAAGMSQPLSSKEDGHAT
ncbi:hypothetical protein JG687_00010135 [Phytophthora cactorum]|uniref:Cilia- and flagella-associated protein 91 n=1 Tax=Phytophthora cactorum TaxID=29920 RepID=A0A8T1UC00_9STRA|nr:hypothetical protein JG687_00010135 [Phytophthora cactorum]